MLPFGIKFGVNFFALIRMSCDAIFYHEKILSKEIKTTGWSNALQGLQPSADHLSVNANPPVPGKKVLRVAFSKERTVQWEVFYQQDFEHHSLLTLLQTKESNIFCFNCHGPPHLRAFFTMTSSSFLKNPFKMDNLEIERTLISQQRDRSHHDGMSEHVHSVQPGRLSHKRRFSDARFDEAGGSSDAEFRRIHTASQHRESDDLKRLFPFYFLEFSPTRSICPQQTKAFI